MTDTAERLYLVHAQEAIPPHEGWATKAVFATSPFDALEQTVGYGDQFEPRAMSEEEYSVWAEPGDQWKYFGLGIISVVVEVPKPGYRFVVPVEGQTSWGIIFSDLSTQEELDPNEWRVLEDLEEINAILGARREFINTLVREQRKAGTSV